ncbi:Lrp/AsnC family transcriptional regulator [Enterovibrio nigricans]|uniref:DNA-binding transcriptional regulator, Lrp family n=1 Tax=Enterovibrio nigricans DSM 22720 TaxID=1121868 RepID=A0A1T4UFD2_9GAMM|nr:Lrp/AsnC family transcriptional regulator [Enterovibrio nigricans]PKF51065.1 Lrp/AsnC family transcriptional regulator [Enterovibrio nigricans]SKA51482.1 DNA-binding transcriptional regulator, Lrp family [Enterovibrio nigricans DSM 22720]
MPASSNLQSLDKLDRKILSNLLSNGRESIANLSRNVGLSRTAVSERINRLEKTGIIKGYTAQIRIDNSSNTASCYLLISCEKGRKQDVSAYLKEIPEVRSTSIVGGSFDIIALVEASDLQSIHYLASEIEGFCGIRTLQTTVVLHQPFCR